MYICRARYGMNVLWLKFELHSRHGETVAKMRIRTEHIDIWR